MATLRNSIGIATDSGLAARLQDQDLAAGMGSLRRGWESGRIGVELNPLRTEALDAELAGDLPRAQSLRGQIDALQQRQGMYAPTVGRVEDINGIGDGLSWAAGRVGQGTASMIDPVAVSAGLGTAGRLAGAIPHPLARAASLGLQGAAMGVPALMSKRQLTGEFIGEAERDPALMARTPPQTLRDMAGNYGALAAIPDSVLPGIIGRQVSGLSRAGSQAARQATMGAGTKTGLGMLGGGGTEALQSAGSQYARGQLNPDRDTSGDFMENVNSFAGGAVGAGPFAAAGAYAEAGHNRAGAGVDAVKDATGSVVDLVGGSAPVAAGKKAFGAARDSVVDLMAGDNAKDTATALVEKLKAGTVDLGSRVQGALNERNILNEIPPGDVAADDAKTMEWLGQNRAARHQLVIDKLAAMPEDDAEAQQHLAAAAAEYPDAQAQDQAVSAAARFVLERSPIGRAEERANMLGENLGKIAGVVGPAIGKGAVAAGKAALGFGKSVLSGAQDGMRKKNAQAEPEQESFASWRDRVYALGAAHAAARAERAQATKDFGPRAELAGNHAADMAKRLRPREPNLALLARHAAFSMSDMVMQVGAKGLGAQNARMNRLVDDLHGAFKTEAPGVLQQLGSIMGPKAAPIIAYMTQELEQQMTPQGPRAKAAARDALGSQVVSLIDPTAQSKLMAQGINLNTPRGREEVLNLMEDFADGVGSASGMRKALDNTFGPESVAGILELLTGQKEQTEVGSVVDDRKQSGEENSDPNGDDDVIGNSAFEQRAAEKSVAKGTSPQVFGFHATVNLRTREDGRDMFAPTEKSKPGEDIAPKRPNLFKKGQQLFGGKGDAIEKKIADIKQQLMEDPAYPDHDSYRVEARSAHDVMKDAGMQPGKVLQLYRDYLLQDGDYEGSASVGSLLARLVRSTKPADAKAVNLAERKEIKPWLEAHPGKTTADYHDQKRAAEAAALAEPVAAATRDAEAYFKERFVVVGEQVSNRDPSKITLPEVLAMHKEGQGLIERSRLSEDRAAAMSDANILMFQSDVGNTASGEIAIPAGKLVKWVKQARGKSSVADAEDTSESFKPKDKDEAYLADVMEGIAVLIGSGRVKGMPYKINQFNQAESFSAGVPDSLRLATKSYGTMKFGQQKRREGLQVDNDKFQGADQELVAADQNRNAEFFTAEDRADRDLVVDEKRTKPRRKQSEQRASDEGGELVTREAGRGTSTKLRVDVSGQAVADPKTDKTDKTPLDFGKRQKDGAPDEYTNQRWLSRQTDADVSIDRAIGPESKGNAASRADYRAEAITAAFLNDPAKGQEMIRMRIRMALAPEYTANKPAFVPGEDPKFTVPGVAGKDQVVGGVHYIAPVAAFVSAKNLLKNNVDLPVNVIQAIQAKVANILLKGKVSDTERIKIARLLVAGTDEKLTAFNVKPVLQRLADGVVQGKAIVTRTEGLAEAGNLYRNALMTVAGFNDSIDRINAEGVHRNFIREEDMLAEHARTKDMTMAERSADRAKGKADRIAKLEEKKAAEQEFIDALVADFGKDALQAARSEITKNRSTGTQLGGREVSIGTVGKDIIARIDAMTSQRQIREFAAAQRSRGEALGDSKLGKTMVAEAEYAERKLIDAAPEVVKAGLPKGQPTQRGGSKGVTVAEHAAATYGPRTKANADAAGLTVAIATDHTTAGEKLTARVAAGKYLAIDMVIPPAKAGVRLAKAMRSLDTTTLNVAGNGIYTLAYHGWSQAQVNQHVYDTIAAAHALLPITRIVTGGQTGVDIAGAIAAKALGIPVAVTMPKGFVQRGEDKVDRPHTAAEITKQITDGAAALSGKVSLSLASSGGRKLNAQDAREGNARVATQQEMDDAKNYALKTLGPKIAVAFKDITGYSGEFIDAQNAIEISTTAAAGTLNTMYHEAMHVFFRDFVKGNPRVQAVFESLINDPKHLAKLHALLDGYPAAQAQLVSGEERLAYTYQFWKAGLLNVDAKAHTWLQKLGKFFRRVLGMVRDSERALELFQAFDNGKMSEPSAAGRVIAAAMDKGTNALKVRRTLDGLVQGLAKLTLPAGVIFSGSVSPTARLLGPMLFTNPGDEAHGGKGEGLINAQRAVALKYINLATSTLVGLSDPGMAQVQKYLQSGVLPRDVPLPEHREAVKAIRDALERFHEHMTASGMKIGKIENYYPTVWSGGALLAKKPAFIALLTGKYAQHLKGDKAEAAERIWQSLVDKEGVDAHLPAGREDGVLEPFFASQENRTLPWFEDVDKETFLDKDMVNTLTRYFHQGARASEYYRRFGANGERLDAMLKKIDSELEFASKEKMKRGEIKGGKSRVKWVARQMRDVSQATGAMEGTLGKDMSPSMRKFNSWMVVYQNIRLLPTMIFSSFVDPLGLTARGAPLQAAFESFAYAMKGVFSAWGDSFRDLTPERAADEWRDLAEHIGVTEVAMFSHHVGDQYASVYMTSGAKKLNDKMFRFNGMEALNRSMRVMATKWATRFIEKQVTMPDANHTKRWLEELGLTAAMITLDDGKLVTNRHHLAKLKGITLAEATKQMEPIHGAIRRWVDGAIITPSAGQRPGWMSDPNFTVFGHLKQFSYAFHQTHLLRAVSELKHGNLAPVGALVMYIPTMIVSDVMKGLVQGGGSLPPYMASMNAGDHLINGVQRAGLVGIGEIGLDAGKDWASLGGPAFEQAIDALRDGMGSKSQINALPLHGLYAQALR